MPDLPHLLITCEHGGNRVPAAWAQLFQGREALLASHCGHDPGALGLARALSRVLGAPLRAARVTRLLVDLNRSPEHPRLFSAISADLSADRKEAILRRHYRPHRRRVEAWVDRYASTARPVLHLAVHSFTPLLDGRARNADVGLLYDTRRPAERDLCLHWQRCLVARQPHLRVRRNYPYRGTSDGLATYLRRRFGVEVYRGVEVEVNQAALETGARRIRGLGSKLAGALCDALET